MKNTTSYINAFISYSIIIFYSFTKKGGCKMHVFSYFLPSNCIFQPLNDGNKLDQKSDISDLSNINIIKYEIEMSSIFVCSLATKCSIVVYTDFSSSMYVI